MIYWNENRKEFGTHRKKGEGYEKSRKPTLVEERHFPFECSISYGVSNDYTALHWHKELEICYIRQGTGNYLINGTEYPFSGGDIFLIGNDEIHLCHDDRDLIMQVFMFAPEFLNSGYANPFDYEFLRPFYERTEHFCNKIEKTPPFRDGLQTCCPKWKKSILPVKTPTIL